MVGSRRVSKIANRGRRRTRRAVRLARAGAQKVPGPSISPATNLLIADIALNGASMLFRRAMERGLLSLRFDRQKAAQVVQGRSLAESAVSYAAARLATRSMPGFVVISGGLLAKSIFDRARGYPAKAEGERNLHEKAAKAEEDGGPLP